MKHLIKVSDDLIISLLGLKRIEHADIGGYNEVNLYWSNGESNKLSGREAKIFWEELNKKLKDDKDIPKSPELLEKLIYIRKHADLIDFGRKFLEDLDKLLEEATDIPINELLYGD